MKNKKTIALAIVGIIAIIIVSSVSTVLVSNMMRKSEEKKEEAKQEQISSAATELKAIMEDENNDYSDIEKAFKEYLPKMDTNTATGFIDSLAYLTHYNLSMMSLDDGELLLIYGACDSDGNYKSDLMSDETLAQKLESLIECHVGIHVVNNEVNLAVDYKYFIDTYGDYMEPDYKAIFEFYAEEQSVSYIKSDSDEFDCDVILDRVEKLDKMCDTYPNSSLYEVMNSTKTFYLKEYFGIYSPDKVFDDDTVKDYMLDSYKTTAKDSSSCIRKKAEKVVEAYAESGNKKTNDVETILYDVAEVTEDEAKQLAEDASEATE